VSGRFATAARTLAVLGVGALAAACGSSAATKGPVVGATTDRPLPVVHLLDEQGHPTTLEAFHGQTVVLAPFLTLCAEQCPITMGGLIQLHDALVAAGLEHRVAVVEVTVDPGRDSPARLRAYSKMIGVPWDHLLTGTPAQVAKLWKHLGIYYAKAPEGTPPNVDWWTHRPETYDVTHQDGLFFVDAQGHERIALIGMANTRGQLPAKLRGLLDSLGRQNLANPGDSWTVRQALDDLGHVMGRTIPSPSGG